MDVLGRYYTADPVSQLLVNQISALNPKNILELGVGQGSLIKAAINKWINASCYVTDIDAKSLKKIRTDLPFVKSFHFDTLKENVAERLAIKPGSIDIAVCNPPYLSLKYQSEHLKLFKSANLEACSKLKIVSSDLIFLAKNLQLLKNKGELGIIVPDSLITGKEYIYFRNALLSEHKIKGIIQLPENIFTKTEALTHILLIEKNSRSNGTTPLFISNKNGDIIDQLIVRDDNLEERMDFNFHSWKITQQKKIPVSLRNIGAEIKRGIMTKIELEQTKDSFLHTTNLSHEKPNLSVKSSKKNNPRYTLTQKGDIILSRVGRNVKISMISKGKVAISDCLYRIRLEEQFRLIVWNALTSEKGKKWLKANRHGVCAKVLSLEDLYNFPIK